MLKIIFSIAAAFIFSTCFCQVSKSKADYETKTIVYKVIGQDSIRADFFRTTTDNKLHPVIVYLHGGALIFGSKNDLSNEQREFYLNAGYSVFAVDYRLAPETKLSSILEDVRDAIVWVQKNHKELHVDPKNIFVVGHSAGGYLALTTGYMLSTPPRGIISFYGYGDLKGKWYNEPSSHYLEQGKIPEEKAMKLISPSVISSASYSQRFDLYLYTRQQGIWPSFVSGHDISKEPDYFDQFSPVLNVSSNYPPVLLIHGDKDTDVPFEQSVLMDKILSEKKINHKFIKMAGFNHVFDYAEGGLSNPKIKKAFDEVIKFMNKHK
jgi:acetyl esterase/lipase